MELVYSMDNMHNHQHTKYQQQLVILSCRKLTLAWPLEIVYGETTGPNRYLRQYTQMSRLLRITFPIFCSIFLLNNDFIV